MICGWQLKDATDAVAARTCGTDSFWNLCGGIRPPSLKKEEAEARTVPAECSRCVNVNTYCGTRWMW